MVAAWRARLGFRLVPFCMGRIAALVQMAGGARCKRMITSQDRFLGCLLGLAAGDAVGTTVEFKPPGTFDPLTDMVGGGPFRLECGEWTDDMAMALCLAASLTEQGGFDPADQMKRYSRWEAEGYMSSNGVCFDIGNTVYLALQKYRASGEPFSGSTGRLSAGNGAIMRLAPVPMYYAADAALAIEYAAESSRTTHGARTCLDACRYFGGLIWAALHGVPKDELLTPHFTPDPRAIERFPLCDEIAGIAAGSFKEKHPPAIQGTGYVVHSLEAALWAFHNSEDFRIGCLLAVNLGNDADTTGAIYGQLAGAYYGVQAIPEHWRRLLARRELIEQIALALYERAGLSGMLDG